MKVIATLVATGPNGQDLGELVKPVEQVWARATDELGVMTCVSQLLAHARDRKFTKVTKIEVIL